MRSIKLINSILIFFFAFFLPHTLVSQTITQPWQLCFHQEKIKFSENWIPASVPGAVQLDYARANNWPPYYFAENWKTYRWMEDVYWTYRTTFKKPVLDKTERFVFVSRGIDYHFEIRLNGITILTQEGMFTPVEIDITPWLQDSNEMTITIFPAPKIPGYPDNRSQAAQSCKPAVSYGWDWHPHLIPLGIWDDTFFQIKQSVSLSTVLADYTLNEELTQASLSILATGKNLAGNRFDCRLIGPNGKVVLSQKGTLIDSVMNITATLDRPQLWWPHDHGEQPLYTMDVTIMDHNGEVLDSHTQKMGFRRIRLVMNEGTWDEPKEFPKSRSHPPITIEINGRRIFAKGSNWVNPEIFPGIITRERYNELLNLALQANFNLFRVWGGGIVNKESFYELCDEKGIMVWTEFPLACNNYKGTPHYLKILEKESKSIIERVRRHPSNVIWCGGNELFNSWSKMTDQSLALRLLNSQCYRYDPGTPFLPTSPLDGMGHGHYVFRDSQSGEEVFQWMPRARNTAYTEFGIPGPSSVEILRQIIPSNELFPPEKGSSWESHHAFNAWGSDRWLELDVLYHYFGDFVNLETLVANGQWLQSEGYKCIFEEARRQKPYCSMVLNWCYNEPWPTAANNSLVNYPAKPKPAFWVVAQSCRPVLASARIPKFQWNEGEQFSCDLFLLNDSYEKVPPGEMTVSLVDGKQKLTILTWDFAETAQNQNHAGPTARVTLPRFERDRFTLKVEISGHPEWNSEYILSYKSIQKKNSQGISQLNQ